MTLTTRIEQAGPGEQRELLFAAAKEIWTWAYAPATVDPDLWVARWVKFNRMLNAEAYLSAAEMLVPEGCGCKLDRYWIAAVDWPVWSASLSFGGLPDDPRRVYEAYDARTPALALLSAIIKSGESG